MSSNQVYCHRFMAMTVPCEIQLFASDAAAIAAEIEANTRRLESKFSFFEPASYLNQQVNQRNADSVHVDEETQSILSSVRKYSEATRGVFDVTIGTVKFYQQQAEATKEVAYCYARPFTGLSAWQLEDRGLHFRYSETKIDLGGVIKEVAVDQAVAIACGHQASGVLINFGGDIRANGRKPDGSDFIVAVLNPKDPSRPLFALPLRDQALTTSAHYARRYQFKDLETSHILAHQGINAQVLSSTVVAENALEAGIFSTALTIEPTLPLPEQVAAALVDTHLNVHQDSEFLMS